MKADVKFCTEPNEIRITLVSDSDAEELLLAHYHGCAMRTEVGEGTLDVVLSGDSK